MHVFRLCCAKGAAFAPAESQGTLEVNTSGFWGSQTAVGGLKWTPTSIDWFHKARLGMRTEKIIMLCRISNHGLMSENKHVGSQVAMPPRHAQAFALQAFLYTLIFREMSSLKEHRISQLTDHITAFAEKITQCIESDGIPNDLQDNETLLNSKEETYYSCVQGSRLSLCFNLCFFGFLATKSDSGVKFDI